MQLWMTRSHGGEDLPLFLNKKIIGICWCTKRDFSGTKKEDFRKWLEKDYPGSGKSIPAWVGFCDSFVNKMKVNDYVITYDPITRVYHLGQISSDYKYEPRISKEMPHIRNVKWFEKTILRDLISNSTKNSLGSPQTIFRLTGNKRMKF